MVLSASPRWPSLATLTLQTFLPAARELEIAKMSSSARQNILSFCTACLLPHTKEKLARVGSVWITAKLGNHRLPLNVVTLHFVGWAIPASRRPPDAHGRLDAPQPRLATEPV